MPTRIVIRTICGIGLVLSVILLIGTAGASDLEVINVHELLMHLAWCVLLFAGSVFGLQVTE